MFSDERDEGAPECRLILAISDPDRNVLDGALPAMHATNRET